MWGVNTWVGKVGTKASILFSEVDFPTSASQAPHILKTQRAERKVSGCFCEAEEEET